MKPKERTTRQSKVISSTEADTDDNSEYHEGLPTMTPAPTNVLKRAAQKKGCACLFTIEPQLVL